MILHSTVLENGLKVYVHEIPHIRTVSLGIWVDQGSKDETDETNGISHLIEHLMFNIPTGESQNPLVRELQAKGARFNATTTKEFTYFHISLMSQYLALGFRTLAAMVQQTEIPPQVLERERQVVLHEHRSVMNSAAQVNERFAQSLWGDHFLGRMVIGQDWVVSQATPDLIQRYVQERYRPDNAGLVIVGGVSHAEALALAEEHFGSWAPGARRSRPQKLRYENTITLIPNDSEEVSLCLGVNGVSDNDPDRYAVELLTHVLGDADQGRLTKEIRLERAMAYTVYAYSHYYQPGGLMAGVVRCHRRDVTEVIRLVTREFARLKTELVSDDELTHVKEVSRTETFMAAENSMQLMRLIGRNAMLGKNYSVNAHIRAQQSVEAEELRATAQRLFTKRDLALAVVGNVDEDALLNALGGCEL